MRFWIACIVWCFLCSTATSAVAQSFDETWAIELHRGPIIAPANIIGMGGAAIGMAEGSGAQGLNPASVANRYPYNGHLWFDWDWSVDWLNVGIGDSSTDIQNSGRRNAQSAVHNWNVALNFLLGRFGIGLNLRVQNFDLACGSDCPFDRALVETLIGGLTLGYAFLDGDLILATEFSLPHTGVTLEGFRPTVDAAPTDVAVELGGGGLTLGALWRPSDWPFRIGLTSRRQISAEPTPESDWSALENGNSTFSVPRRVSVPWTLGLGAAFSLGPRTLNPRRPVGEELAPAGYRAPLWREYWLVAADLVLVGPSERATGIEAWLENDVQQAGKKPTLSVRFGVESEFWPHFMRARAGAYYEPSRFEDVPGRWHGTGGLDINLYEWIWDWRGTLAFDGASGYLNTMLSVGFWH